MAYVYSHIKLDTGEIFYIGIGSKPNFYRAYQRTKRNRHWDNIVAKHGLLVSIIYRNLSWADACKKESDIIRMIGRLDRGKGPLINRTDGGQGASGAIVSEETKKKITAGKLGKKRPPITEETRRKLGAAIKAAIRRDSPVGEPSRPKNFKFLHSPEITAKRILSLMGSQTEPTRLKRQEKWRSPANPRSKLVINLETGIYYEQLQEAWVASGLSITRPLFSRMLLGNRKNITSFRYA